MESRNILDYLGNIIGVLQLPIGTIESIWTAQLLLYSYYQPDYSIGEMNGYITPNPTMDGVGISYVPDNAVAIIPYNKESVVKSNIDIFGDLIINGNLTIL